MLRLANNYLNPTFTLSLVIFSSLGYTISLILPVNITGWSLLLIISVLIAFMLVVFILNRRDDLQVVEEEQHSVRTTIVAMLPYLLFLPAMILFLQTPSMQISYHGDLHAGYVNQIIYGVGQPDNVYLVGSEPAYYWLYHVLIATLSYMFKIPHPTANAYLTIVTFISTIGWIYKTLPFVIMKRLPPILMSMVTIFALFGMNLFGFIHSMVDMYDNFNIWEFFSLISPVPIGGNLKLVNLLDKYINYNSFPLAVLYGWVLIYVAVKMIRGKAQLFDGMLFIAAVGGGAAFLLVGGLFLPGAVICGILSVYALTAFEEKRTRLNFSFINIWGKVCFLVGACFLLMPISIYTFRETRNISLASHETLHFMLVDFNGIFSIFGSYYPLLPFILVALYVIWYEHDKTLTFLFITAVAGLSVTYFVKLSEEYKFILLIAFPLTLMSIRIVDRFSFAIQSEEPSRFRQISLAVPIIITMFACVAINLIGMTSTLKRNDVYQFEGQSVINATNRFQDVFTWIRIETSPETILIMQPHQALSASLLSEHMPYIVADSYNLASSLPEYRIRVSHVSNFMNAPVASADWQNAFSAIIETFPERPLVFVIPHDVPNNELNVPELQRVFDGEFANIYLLQERVNQG